MTRYIHAVETAKLIRARLKKEFPETSFRVRTDQYSGGSSIRVRWLDGPMQWKVRRILSFYQGSDFDSMQDMKVPRGSVLLDGEEVKFCTDFIFCDKERSPEEYARFLSKVCRFWGVEPPRMLLRESDYFKGELMVSGVEGGGMSIPQAGGRDLHQLLWQEIQEEERNDEHNILQGATE